MDARPCRSQHPSAALLLSHPVKGWRDAGCLSIAAHPDTHCRLGLDPGPLHCPCILLWAARSALRCPCYQGCMALQQCVLKLQWRSCRWRDWWQPCLVH